MRKFLDKHNLPDSAKILVQRIEDAYYEKHGWDTIKKEGFTYNSSKRFIEDAKPGGKFHNKENYPKMTEENIQEILDIEKYLEEDKDEYHPVWCPVKYENDDNLYLDLHY